LATHRVRHEANIFVPVVNGYKASI